jgi:putative DNA primase/helicase
LRLTRPACTTGSPEPSSHGDDYVGLDLDDCRDPETGEIALWAQEIIDGMDSYTEVSPSGTGVKIWVRAMLEMSKEKKEDGKRIEIYPHGRFFTVTGLALNGPEIKDRQRELDALIVRE